MLVAACGVSPEKTADGGETTPETGTSAAQASASDPGAGKASETSGLGAADPRAGKTEDSGAQVIEPKMAAETDIKLEAIPEAPPATESAAGSQDNTMETPPPSVSATPGSDKDAPGVSNESPVNIAKIDPVPAKPVVSAPSIPTSTGPDHFVITVAKKDQRHPAFGEGHDMGFLINGVPGGAVVVERGKTYRFDVVTDPKHDVYFSTKAIGWGASAWSEGVLGAYIYQGTITFTPPDSAPPVLYYSCRNHPNMGGEIHVVGAGEKVDLAKLSRTSSAALPADPAAKPKPEVSVAMVNQKLTFADMLVNSVASKRVKNSANEEAKQMQQKAENLVTQARGELKNGDNRGAYANVEQALGLLKSAARLVPSEEELVGLKEQHEELLHSVLNFEQSHEENYQRILKSGGSNAAVNYDKKKVAEPKEQAKSLAQKNDYMNANKNLEAAQRLITTAIQQMLHSQTIVYDLNFETPQEEYEYELKRFGGYEELIPVAVEQKQPNEGTKKLMDSYVEKGQKMRSTAVATAKAGDYPRAIAMLQDATDEIRRALRMVGVMQ